MDEVCILIPVRVFEGIEQDLLEAFAPHVKFVGDFAVMQEMANIKRDELMKKILSDVRAALYPTK